MVARHADPLTFLTARHILSTLVFIGLSLGVKAAWPRDPRMWRDALVAGVLLHGIYLSGVFWAVGHGAPAGLTALITGLHPLLTAMLALPLLHERLVARQWAGIAVGFVGVALIVAPKMQGVAAVPLVAILAALVATLGFTLGNLWQKHSKPAMDLRVNATIQYMGALGFTAPIAFATEAGRFDWSPALWGALAWAVFGLSVGGISILLILLKRGAASKVAPLLYLSPPLAALMALFLFQEPITAIQLVGMVLAVGGAFAARH